MLTLARDITAVPESLKRWLVEGGAPHQLKLRYRPSETKVSDILDQVRASQLEIADLTTVETDLEDIFLQLTRRGPGGAAGSAAKTRRSTAIDLGETDQLSSGAPGNLWRVWAMISGATPSSSEKLISSGSHASR